MKAGEMVLETILEEEIAALRQRLVEKQYLLRPDQRFLVVVRIVTKEDPLNDGEWEALLAAFARYPDYQQVLEIIRANGYYDVNTREVNVWSVSEHMNPILKRSQLPYRIRSRNRILRLHRI